MEVAQQLGLTSFCSLSIVMAVMTLVQASDYHTQQLFWQYRKARIATIAGTIHTHLHSLCKS